MLMCLFLSQVCSKTGFADYGMIIIGEQAIYKTYAFKAEAAAAESQNRHQPDEDVSCGLVGSQTSTNTQRF